MNNTILIGFKSSGKTTLGSALAKELNKEFIDTDNVIEQLYMQEKNEKKTCREIYESRGDPYFRNLETQAIKSLKTKQNCIIAVGGGSVDKEENRKHLSAIGTIIYLNEDKKRLYERLSTQHISFIKTYEDFETLYNKRSPLYERLSDHTLNVNWNNPKQVLIDALKIVK